ncbi:MAG TPA: hypothetical protein VHF25_00005 [Nitriliruptorales bacterium]|nr:hypothetical protein [Nitriliruptorales bacterium]
MTAWACTNLATLNLSEASGPAGQDVDVTGSSFRTAERGGQEVALHWNAVDGPVLATATPDATGNIATSITIPADATPGYYVIVATQNELDDETGEVSPAYGTPARASFLVGDVSPADIPQPASAGNAVVAAEGTSGGLLALTALLALAGIGLFAAGLGLFVREVRRRGVPAPVEKKS